MQPSQYVIHVPVLAHFGHGSVLTAAGRLANAARTSSTSNRRWPPGVSPNGIRPCRARSWMVAAFSPRAAATSELVARRRAAVSAIYFAGSLRTAVGIAPAAVEAAQFEEQAVSVPFPCAGTVVAGNPLDRYRYVARHDHVREPLHMLRRNEHPEQERRGQRRGCRARFGLERDPRPAWRKDQGCGYIRFAHAVQSAA